MNVHNNARLTPRGREILISRLQRGERPRDVATAIAREMLGFVWTIAREVPPRTDA